jgi:sarcosine oxidase subunit delta
MSFLLPCPNCGERSAYEFRFGGEVKPVPPADAPEDIWMDYRFHRTNTAGVQTEWWFHRSGCGQWFQAVRNTVSNEVLESFLPQARDL